MDRIREDELNDNLVSVFFALMLVLGAALQWIFRAPPGSMFLATCLVFAAVAAYAVPRIRRAQAKLRHLKQGRDGERAVGEYLDTLREDGVRVLHDIRGDNFNIDHVVIAPQGVFTIETKTLSKPAHGDAQLHYDGECVRIGSYEPERNPIVPARTQAAFLKQLLLESTGKTFNVRSAVVFPGWFIEDQGSRKPGAVRVLEPKSLRGFINHEPMHLGKDDIALATFHLKRYVRAS